MKRTLYLVRHGDTDFNSKQGGGGEAQDTEARVRSWIDVPLNHKGRLHAAQMALKLRDQGIEKITTSDLDRAKETAQIIGHITKAPVEETHGLRPWDMGDLAGQKVVEAKPKIDHYFTHPTEKIPGGESYEEFHSRAKETLLGILHRLNSEPGGNEAAVTHLRVFGTLANILTNNRKAAQLEPAHSPPGTAWKIEVGDGKFKLTEYK